MTGANPIRVLVVDDTAVMREMLAWTLEGGGYEVVQTASGRAALEIVEALPPALILLDLHIPGMNGSGVIEAAGRDQELDPLWPRAAENYDQIRPPSTCSVLPVMKAA